MHYELCIAINIRLSQYVKERLFSVLSFQAMRPILPR